ncbi:MAG: hypothetical protein R3F65_04135 [bacterium]
MPHSPVRRSSLAGFTAALAIAFVGSACTESGGDEAGPVILIIDEDPAQEPEPTAEPEPAAEPEPEAPEPEPTAEPEPDPGPTCAAGQDDFAAPAYARLREEGGNLTYLALADIEARTTLAFVVEFRGAPAVGTHDLAAFDLNDCTVCPFAIEDLNLSGGTRTATLMPVAGTLEVVEAGAIGEPVRVELRGAIFQEVTVSQGALGRLNVTVVDGGKTRCADGAGFEQLMPAPPAGVGESVRPFQLQNCETEEFVDIGAMSARTGALWFVGSAGWCTACRQYLPAVFELMASTPPEQAELLVVLGEDVVFGPSDPAYCRRYASHYGLDDAHWFYVDHDGVGAFSVLFGALGVYTDEQGQFGLPWNAIVTGGEDMVYTYSDRSGQPETLVDVLRDQVGLPVE